MNKRTLVNLVFFLGVFALMLFWAANNIITIDALEDPYTITGDFEQASGVSDHSEVTYLGVHYGQVAAVERRDGGVRVTMKIDKGKEIPAGSIARIFRKSAIGEPYIDFVPPDSYDEDTSGRIEPGDNVPRERTTVPLEFSELLRSAGALVSSIEPEQAGSLIHELSLALEGRGDSLRTLTTAMDELTSSFAARTDQLDRLAENNTRITGVLAEHRLSLGRSIENLRTVAETLRDADGNVQVLLDVGPDFLRTTADLVADQKRNLDCLLTDLAPILRTLNQPQQLDDLAQTLEKGPLGFSYSAAATDQEADGLWVRINLMVPLTGEDAAAYVPPKTLPVVPSVPACASTLTPALVAQPTGASSSPAPAVGASGSDAAADQAGTAAGHPGHSGPTDDAGGSLAATGGVALAAAALLLLAGALGLRHLRRPNAGADDAPTSTP